VGVLKKKAIGERKRLKSVSQGKKEDFQHLKTDKVRANLTKNSRLGKGKARAQKTTLLPDYPLEK